ncbi:MAG: response regulator [Thermodesulfovibrionales bacterium]|jgi:CheY-like chemotaxis protein
MIIIIIDDSNTVREIVKFGLLNKFPHIQVDEARDGKEGQEKLEKGNYDLILCDWEMPKITGDRLLKWVRSNPRLQGTPFIMVSAVNEKTSIMKALQLGANAYILKPFTIDALVQKIVALTGKFERREHERIVVNSPVSVKFQSHKAEGHLIDISLGGVFSVFHRNDHLPQILETVVLDVEGDEHTRISGLEGFVMRLQAAEAVADSGNIKVAIKFSDMNCEKEEEFKCFLDSLKTKISAEARASAGDQERGG